MQITKLNHRKGSVLFSVLLGILVIMGIVALYGAYTFFATNAAYTEELINRGPPIGQEEVSQTTIVSSQTKDYTGETLKFNLNFQDRTGTARNPTCYYYNNENYLSAIAPKMDRWNDERAWVDQSGAYIDSGTASSGKLQKSFQAGNHYWIHCSISGYQDLFLSDAVIPTSGDLSLGDAKDTNIGVDTYLENGARKSTKFTIWAWDTTAWTASAIDLNQTAVATETVENRKFTSYTIAKNKAVQLSQLKITNVSKFSDEGVRYIWIEIPDKNGVTHTYTVYDYGAGIDNTKYDSAATLQTYDSNNVAGEKEYLKNSYWVGDQTASITVIVNANTATGSASAGDGLLENGELIGVITLSDMEGNALISAQSITL